MFSSNVVNVNVVASYRLIQSRPYHAVGGPVEFRKKREKEAGFALDSGLCSGTIGVEFNLGR